MANTTGNAPSLATRTQPGFSDISGMLARVKPWVAVALLLAIAILGIYGFQTFQSRQTTFNLYEKIDDFFQDTHNYLKYLKFGYSRCTDHASMEIRNQRMTREEGIEMIKKYEHHVRPKNLDVFLKFAGLTEKQFLDSVDHLIDPDIWEKDDKGKYHLKDWIGNHIWDKGIEDARLPIKEKWYTLKSPEYKLTRNSNLDDSEELIFL